MEGILKVTPDQLISTATEFSNTGSVINNLTSKMIEIVNSLKSTWEGDASSAYNEKFNGLQDDIQKINRMIQEHSKDLTEMGNAYKTAESSNQGTVDGLEKDVII